MLIGLISDTHIPEITLHLPAQVKEVFKDVELILHAGDLYTRWVLDELERLAPVLSAQGDDEYPDTENDERVDETHILTVDGTTILLKHILWWWPDQIDRNSIYTQNGRSPDIVVYGHTHRAKIENKGGALLVNPGSPTFPGYRRGLGTVALLNIKSGKAEARIIRLRERT